MLTGNTKCSRTNTVSVTSCTRLLPRWQPVSDCVESGILLIQWEVQTYTQSLTVNKGVLHHSLWISSLNYTKSTLYSLQEGNNGSEETLLIWSWSHGENSKVQSNREHILINPSETFTLFYTPFWYAKSLLKEIRTNDLSCTSINNNSKLGRCRYHSLMLFMF